MTCDMTETEQWAIGEDVWVEYENQQKIGKIISTDFGGYYLIKVPQNENEIIVADKQELHKISEEYEKGIQNNIENANPLYMAIAELIQIGQKSRAKKKTNILRDTMMSLDKDFAEFVKKMTDNIQ